MATRMATSYKDGSTIFTASTVLTLRKIQDNLAMVYVQVEYK